MSWADLLFWVFGAAGPGTAFAAWLKRYLERRREQEFFASLAADRRIGDALRGILDATGASRVLLLKAENGGGIPSPGNAEIKATIMKESAHRVDGRALNVWQQRRVDEPYMQMLTDLHQRRHVLVVTADMSDQQLKDFYLHHRVHHSELFAVAFLTHPCAFVYFSLHFADDREMTPAGRDVVNGAISTVASLLSRHRRLVMYRPVGED